MVELEKSGFDTNRLSGPRWPGAKNHSIAPKEAFFSQGDPADSIFYLQKAAQGHGCFRQREGSCHRAPRGR